MWFLVSCYGYLLIVRRIKSVEKIRTRMVRDIIQTTAGLNISALYIDLNRCGAKLKILNSQIFLIRHEGALFLCLNYKKSPENKSEAV